jgi:hypothetical protein
MDWCSVERARFQATVSFGIILFNQYCLLPRARGLEDWGGWKKLMWVVKAVRRREEVLLELAGLGRRS